MPIAKFLESYTGNLMLSTLPKRELDNIEDSLERIEVDDDQSIWESGESRDHLYFPVSALISLSYETDTGSSVSIATIGRSGIVGSNVLAANVRTPDRAAVLQGGSAFRMNIKSAKDELADCGPFQELLLAYTQLLMAKISQNAICNRLHRIEQQLCRWLLDCSFELRTDMLHMTHDRIACVLGVRRESVSLAMSNLDQQKLIKGGRGKLQILDRSGLEKGSCECYGVVKDQLERSLERFRSDQH